MAPRTVAVVKSLGRSSIVLKFRAPSAQKPSGIQIYYLVGVNFRTPPLHSIRENSLAAPMKPQNFPHAAQIPENAHYFWINTTLVFAHLWRENPLVNPHNTSKISACGAKISGKLHYFCYTDESESHNKHGGGTRRT